MTEIGEMADEWSSCRRILILIASCRGSLFREGKKEKQEKKKKKNRCVKLIFKLLEIIKQKKEVSAWVYIIIHFLNIVEYFFQEEIYQSNSHFSLLFF